MASSDKYDRQLRLWGASGQRALSKARICLIQADGVGTEALKNLVLPGIGSFTILDDFVVEEEDLESNFFVSPEFLKQPRAEVVKNLLVEMNPEVHGISKVANFKNTFYTNPSFFLGFDLIITSNIPSNQLLEFSQFTWKHRIPMMILRSYGLIGYYRIQIRDHEIIESRIGGFSSDKGPKNDMRIADPFPLLKAYFDSIHLEALDSLQHAHVPYLVILYKALEAWKDKNHGNPPQTFDEKKQFRQSIQQMAHNFQTELNFEEAYNEYYLAYAKLTPSPELVAIFESNRVIENLGPDSRDFDFMVRALDLFMTSHDGQFPLHGNIPDMTSTTDGFVQLQSIYKEKATQDLQDFTHILKNLLGKGNPSQPRIIDQERVELFCKNAPQILTLSSSSLEQELLHYDESCLQEAFQDELFDDPLQTPIVWYLLLRAADAFYRRYARWPGAGEESCLQKDAVELYQEVVQLCQSYRLEDSLYQSLESVTYGESIEISARIDKEMDQDETVQTQQVIQFKHAQELARYGAAELHNISAIIGGIAAQEAVKIITCQYVPLDNTYIFNGIASCGAVHKL